VLAINNQLAKDCDWLQQRSELFTAENLSHTFKLIKTNIITKKSTFIPRMMKKLIKLVGFTTFQGMNGFTPEF